MVAFQSESPHYGWTEPLPTARLRADPSGVQDVGTAWQSVLLPGLTTVTTGVRYVSLFTAARYLRQRAGENVAKGTPLDKLWRRLEAIIAVSSVLHHEKDGEPPGGIIGRTYADRVAIHATIPLETGLQNPPYRIYRGSLGALRLFDLGTRSDPLFERAQLLGRAWSPSTAGKVGALLAQGSLPETLPRATLSSVADSFCICRVPKGSREQKELIDLLFGFLHQEARPQFVEETTGADGARVASWRLLLEVVEASPSRLLWGEHLMGRILESDMLDLPLSEPVHQTLLIWRWIAARSFFERGWTLLFNRTFDQLRRVPFGLSNSDLRQTMRDVYTQRCGNEGLAQLVQEASANLASGDWLAQRFQERTPRDPMQLIVAGLYASEADRKAKGLPILETLRGRGSIAFTGESSRLRTALARGDGASDFWADTAIETLVQHIRTSLRKMRQGNPDTLHVDYEGGRWTVPTKAMKWSPLPAFAFSRLDVAMGWAQQLGLVREEGDCKTLTPLGTQVRRRWDEFYKIWE